MAEGSALSSAAPEQFEGSILRDNSDALSHMISQVSNDSIRQLIKLASCGFEEDFVLDDIDLSDICETWDTPTIPEIPPPPTDFQMDVDIVPFCMHPGFDQNNNMPCSEVRMSEEDIHHPVDYHQDSVYTQDEFDDRCMTGNVEPKAIPEMGVKKPRVNLVLGSNVVRLDPCFCPKPSVRVLPGHVIQAPSMAVETETPYRSVGCSTDESNCLLMDGWHGEGYDWPIGEQGYRLEQMPVYDPQGEAMYEVVHRGVRATENYLDTVQAPNPFLGHVGFDDSAQYDRVGMFVRTEDDRDNKVIRKNTKEDKAPGFVALDEDNRGTIESVAERLDACQIESRSTEIRKIQSMSEADLCNYVKTMAPQLQNNAMEEIVKETKFEERLARAEQKMVEHTTELERIRQMVSSGEVPTSAGAEMMRKVYNRREAAASRTRFEQGLVKAAIKKRTLEKICSWMREHFFGNSDLFSMNSLDSDVRRSRSDGTKDFAQ